MGGCGCRGAIPKSDGEPAVVDLQEAVKTSRQSETIIYKFAERRHSVIWSSRERR